MRDIKFDEEEGHPFFPKSEIILVQYTGLKDKNGKEICEGDILAIGYGPDYGYCQQKEVKFHEGSFGCFMECDNYFNEGFYQLSDIIDSSEIEVIGNIYEVDKELD